MEDRLAVRGAPGGFGGPPGGGGAIDESEEEKVYYGFGVFMGLPLADLRAMKDEYLQNQQTPSSQLPPSRGASAPIGRGHSNGNGMGHAGGGGRAMLDNDGGGGGGVPMRGPPPTAYGEYGEYEMRDPMGRSHGMVRGDRGHGPPSSGMDRGGGGMPRDMDPRMMAHGGGGGGGMLPHYGGDRGGGGGMRMPPGRRGVEYDASVDGIGGPNGGGHPRGHHQHPDDEGDSSDGSYSTPKSHSLNFILH